MSALEFKQASDVYEEDITYIFTPFSIINYSRELNYKFIPYKGPGIIVP